MQRSVALPAEQKPIAVNGCLAYTSTFCTLVWTISSTDSKRCSFHFEQVPHQSMQTQLRYWWDRRTDRWLFSFICIDIHSISICVLTFLLEYIFIIIVPQPIKLFVPLIIIKDGQVTNSIVVVNYHVNYCISFKLKELLT